MTAPLFTLAVDELPLTTAHSEAKSHGLHYTPSELARFVARRSLAHVVRPDYVVLDPACGDGELLWAVAVEARRLGLKPPHLVGIDRDPQAVAAATSRLADAGAASVLIKSADFLLPGEDIVDELPASYDLVVSNPPYVRTQVLGAARAQQLAKQFGLTGRVDLYHAFVAAMSAKLSADGVLGLLCSNRFLSTKGGASLRSILLRDYEVAELWDLGDSKLFDAAVLPAVIIGKRVAEVASKHGTFVRVYEDNGTLEGATECTSVLDALESGEDGAVAAGSGRYLIERGTLADPTALRPWQLSSPSNVRWTEQVKKRTSGLFGDIGPIRVGVKTTADSVFIRPTWADLPEALRPESELLRPLITHHSADRWVASDAEQARRSILYTHEIRDGRRRPIEVERFPRALAYLETHRERLEGRAYVAKAGRAWYEIWVPQQPDAWAAPKLVWPDIADRPRFFLDRTGAVVNGDCYWQSCKGRSAEEIAVAVAVANSTFATQYYDLACGNRLYAGRRRFITQYLEQLPLPITSTAEASEIRRMVDRLSESESAKDVVLCAELERDLDNAVSELFGLKESAR